MRQWWRMWIEEKSNADRRTNEWPDEHVSLLQMRIPGTQARLHNARKTVRESAVLQVARAAMSPINISHRPHMYVGTSCVETKAVQVRVLVHTTSSTSESKQVPLDNSPIKTTL